MSEHVHDDDSSVPAATEQDLAALIRKMQQQLTFLEKKIDILINQSAANAPRENHFSKPFRPTARPPREGNFSKPFRPFERSHRPFERTHGKPSGEKSFDRHPQESGFGQGRPYKKRYEGEKRGFDQKKKPFHFARKERG
ncbi:MAG: hypothetical protein WCG78_00355 [Candidatus Omnitrophota bacterium]